MGNIETFAAAVERRRRSRGLTLGDVAEEANLSRSYLSKLLHGQRRLLPDVVQRIDAAVQADGELRQIAERQDVATSRPRPMQLPPGPASWVGRTAEFHALDAALVQHDPAGNAATTVVIEGGPWVGKTALALRWAARVRARFPGGCLFANLGGVDGPREAVLDGFLRALGAGAEVLSGTPAVRVAWYRSMLAQQPTLVILDDVADYSRVRDLLPGPGSVVVVTSRAHQPALLLHTGGLLVNLRPLAHNDALTLLRRRLGEARLAADPRASDTVADRCGGLPAALLLAAEFLEQHHLTMSALAHMLDSAAITVLASPDPALNLQHVVGRAYHALSSDVRRVFRLLATSPAPQVGVHATTALSGLDIASTQNVINVLQQAHLIHEVGANRLRLNPVIRAFAQQRSAVEDSLGDIDGAHTRLLRWYAATAWAASNALAPGWASTAPLPLTSELSIDFDYEIALAWCSAEVPTALHVARHCRNAEAEDAIWGIVAALSPYFYLAGCRESWLTAASEGLAVAHDAGSQQGIAACSQSLGWALHELGRAEDGLTYLSTAAEYQVALNDHRGLAWSILGQAACHENLGRYAEAQRAFERADRLFVDHDIELGSIVARGLVAGVLQRFGAHDAACKTVEDALIRAQRLGFRPVTAFVQHRHGLILQCQQRHHAALSAFDAALTLRRNSDERRWQAETLAARADTLTALRQNSAAVEAYEQAACILAELRDPRAVDVRVRAATLVARMRSSR
ncbi:helix-turn-helix domain-containing protein [Amycolatopsis magusensis]|uniref:helix-turn-helix domain-containing protein n=1 Tax=Amycolatopsis magusensis TaxID=882444 RepID=UPI0024A8C451|nr:helix-turn-helix domain-containing protein [Amycolatopsis magusensis]MDI5977985.1 helix-turn-helix domain-containing protein [Amycolatopsis magusensis]